MPDPQDIPRLNPPPEGHVHKGWCLYEDDRWDGPVPQEYDDQGWLVYPDRNSAFRGLAREMRRRCELFEAGQMPGEFLACSWYPREVTYLPNGWPPRYSVSRFHLKIRKPNSSKEILARWTGTLCSRRMEIANKPLNHRVLPAVAQFFSWRYTSFSNLLSASRIYAFSSSPQRIVLEHPAKDIFLAAESHTLAT